MASKQKSQNFLEGAKASIVREETDESQESVRNPLEVQDIDSATSEEEPTPSASGITNTNSRQDSSFFYQRNDSRV